MARRRGWAIGEPVLGKIPENFSSGNFNSKAKDMLRLLSRFLSLFRSVHGASACLGEMLDIRGLSHGEVSCFFFVLGVINSPATVLETCRVVTVVNSAPISLAIVFLRQTFGD